MQIDTDNQKFGVLVCGHGSRSQAAVDEFSVVATHLKKSFPDWPVEYGYLEFANPVINHALDALRKQGVTHVLAVPGMLFAAAHAKNDIPSVLNAYAAKHGIQISYGRELGVDLQMIRASADRIDDAVNRANTEAGVDYPVEETCLVVIGRGASDPDANSNVSKVARMLWEGKGFGWTEVGYSGVTFPLVAPCLEHVVKLGYKRVVVFPYFLFTGILIDRIYGFTDEIAKKYPEIEFVKASYLNDHKLVIKTFVDRVYEILDGQNLMNCALCKYRAQALGFEHEVGLVQESHHHHVEGQGANAPGSSVSTCNLCDTFCTGACRLPENMEANAAHTHSHQHDHHHHAEYPHKDHPLGPESVRAYDPRKN